MEKISQYSESSGYDEEMTRTKRSMAIALASVLFLAITPVKYWHGSASHPSICERIRAFTESSKVSEESHLWIYLSSMLLFVLTKNHVEIEPAIIVSQRSYCFQLLNLLEKNPKIQDV